MVSLLDLSPVHPRPIGDLLGAEAILLSRMYPLPLSSTLAARLKVAAEKEPSGRGATS
jgi:hypothetical protein